MSESQLSSLDSSSADQILAEELVEQVLMKLGLACRPAVDLSGLSRVYDAWCRSVPFDNLRKLIHVNENNPSVLPGDTAVDFFQSWLRHSTGGTCWSGNGALHALLTSLGFVASRGIATMLVAPDLPPNHGTVLVKMDDTLYVVDASILHERPLRLDLSNPAETALHLFPLKVTNSDDKWHIWWQPLHLLDGIQCRLDSYPTTHADFQRRYEMSREWSPFNYQLTARKIRGEKTVGIGFGKWVELSSTGSPSIQIIGEEARSRYLIENLGYSEEIVSRLPADRSTPPPPWSETAKKSGQL
ncbi:MAG: arylamine N-acetyltransferase [Cyanobacteria bacterium]|nr:arylamine N-acetyltransferase [Cyanobacteriota bacterium]